jgi:hypothetical protein
MTTQVLALPSYDKSSLHEDWTISNLVSFASDTTVVALVCEFKSFEIVPTVVVGGQKTEIRYWSAAQIVFPDAEYLVGDKGVLSELNFRLPVLSDEDPEPVAEISDVDSKNLVQEAFKFACWEDSSEHRRKLSDIEDKAEMYILSSPGLIVTVKNAIRNGKKSNGLKQDLKRKLQKGDSSDDAKRWIEKVSQGNRRIQYDLSKALKDHKKHHEDRKKRYIEKYTPGLSQVVVERLHKNNLRALKPSKKWQIVIDETGSHFNKDDMLGLTPGDIKIGKVVALAIPQEVTLPKLTDNFHAVDCTDRAVEEAISTILSNNVGVFGFSMSDPYFTIHSWMAAVAQLAKWVMYLLPIEEGSDVDVEFLIEQRGQFEHNTNLQALQENLESTLKDLAPSRYKNLRLKLLMMDKDGHPANGYVDSIANIWGSPSNNRRKILARSALRDHCLLDSSERNLEQLLLALQSSEPLHDRLWFELCDFAGTENKYSLANQFLCDLGARCSSDIPVWNSYVVSLKQRLQDKTFTTAGLTAALQWLQIYSPNEACLDDSLLLQLKSSQLALKNHQGHIDLNLASECMYLANDLKEEMAVDCCNVVLRIASSTTNAFDFEVAVDWVKSWLAEPIAVPGLLNYGKLHSVLGQLYAFQQNHQASLMSFDSAIESFSKLSNALQRKKNKIQTQMYMITVLMDQRDQQAITLLNNMLDHEFNMVKGHSKRIKRLARSDEQYRFLHHLFLRACIYFPEEMKDDADEYLACSDDWIVGEAHPWMLIQVYRGWLLQRTNELMLAQTCFDQGVSECLSEKQGPTVKWMGVVLEKLALSLGISAGVDRQTLNFALLAAPEKAPQDILGEWGSAQTDDNRIKLLGASLPFNFH